MPTATTTATATSPAGEYPIAVVGGSDNNYKFQYKNGTLTIKPNTVPDDDTLDEDSVSDNDETVSDKDAVPENDEAISDKDAVPENDEAISDKDAVSDNDEILSDEDNNSNEKSDKNLSDFI